MATAEKLENLLNLSEAAKAANMNPITLRALCQRGGLGNYARKIGDSWVIAPQGMFELINSRNFANPDIENPFTETGAWYKIQNAAVRLENVLCFPEVKGNEFVREQIQKALENLNSAI